MDFSIIFRLREKRFWWMDVIFYFVVSSLIATVLCYLLFLVKNNIQRKEIRDEIAALETVGTEQQKGYEEEVISYQKKVIDFTKIFSNHEFASNVFAFMEKQTMPNIWFKQFTLDRKNRQVQLTGESDDMDAFSRQVASLEKNEYVKSVGNLNSALGESAKIDFNFNLVLDPKIFDYIPEEVTTPDTETTIPSQPGTQPGSQKLITVFDILLTPEVIGVVDQTNYTITLDVPYGTDVTRLNTFIVVSPGSAVSPASGLPQDFTTPIIYEVTAQDGTTQDYIATVRILSKEGEAPDKSGHINIWLIIILVLVVIAAIAAIIWFAIRKLKIKKQKQAQI